MSPGRRRATRYQFIAEAEVLELESGVKFKAKTGDLSSGGCFLDIRSPCTEGKAILVRIIKANATFTAQGRIVFVFPKTGVGVEFTSVEIGQEATLQEWLSELSSEPARHGGLSS
jgi:hypothetical protein